MTKPVTALSTFAGVSPPWNLSLLDADIAALQAAINDVGTYSNYLVDGSGAANQITVNTPGSVTFALVSGALLQVKIANTTTSGTVSMTVNGGANTSLVGTGGAALVPGQLVAGGIYLLLYNGTAWQVTNASDFGRTAAEITAAITPTNYAFAPGYVERYGADNTGVANSATAFAAAVSQWQAGGSTPRAGAGTFRVDSQTDFITTSASTFVQGAVFIGAGMLSTIIDNRVANGFVFNVDTNTTLKFQLGCFFSGFQIKTTTSPATSGGIRLRRAFNVVLDNVHIIGLTGDGLQMVVNEGDGDGPNVVWLRSSRIENCAGWGINCNLSAGHNELSFVDTSSSIISANGTASAALPPPSGGIHWKGQICQLRNGSCVINQNVGLYIEGTGGGLPAQFFLENWSFENNVKKHVYCTGIDSFKARNTQMYSNDSFIAQYGMLFDATSADIRGIDIDGCIVRATSGNNAYTAFSISGANARLDTCRIKRVSWQNFDYTGQARFSGFQFDPIQQQCEFVILGTALCRLRPRANGGLGNTTPIRLRLQSGSTGNAPSTSGEWVPVQLTSTGLSITNATLAINTTYHVYLYDVQGAPTLEIVTDVPVLDSASGYWVKTGDATRLWCGGVATDGSSNFIVAGSNYLNATQLGNGAGAFLWADSTGRLRIKATFPTSNTDGVVVGTQT